MINADCFRTLTHFTAINVGTEGGFCSRKTHKGLLYKLKIKNESQKIKNGKAEVNINAFYQDSSHV